jgi:predicted short-subunit dehydrogenase-like oxidoreductase (DUF2520 family)
MNKITFIGAGNVATNLSLELKKKGYEIVEVWSKTEASAAILANKLKCNTISNLDKISKTDLIIISVKDKYIKEVIDNIADKNTAIVHTSGSVDLSVFAENKNPAVFYPLQSFNKNIDVKFNNLPICIESNNSELEDKLVKIANSITQSVHLVNSEQREKLHIAAVFACNFTNHMLSISNKIMNDNSMDFDILKPLIEHTFKKAIKNTPKEMQSGPAIRGEYNIIEKHLNILEENHNLQILYSKITNHIINNDFDQ